MRIAFAAVLVAVLGGALPVGAVPVTCTQQPAAARRYIDIDVLEQGFSPLAQQAATGDVIRWTVRGGAKHIVQSYAPLDVFSPSPEIVVGDVFCVTFGGGSIWYRDAFGQTSAVNKTSNVCQGRCGSVSDRTADPAAPSIKPLNAPSEQRLTLIEGTTEPLTLVKLADVPSGETLYDKGTPVGQALAGQNGLWKVELDLAGGSHYLVGRALDATGAEGPDSTTAAAPVTVEVIQDTQPPTLTATAPTPPVIIAGSSISGTATDNARIARVDIIVSDFRDGSNILGDSGRAAASITSFTCGLSPCPRESVSWTFAIKPVSKFKISGLPTEPSSVMIPLGSGIFNVRVTAYDAWFNASPPATFQVVVVGPPTVGLG